jgi:lipoate-protein ligase A
VPRLIRIGRPNIAAIGVRSADKPVSPLSWFTSLSCADVAQSLVRSFSKEFRTHQGSATPAELEAARQLVSTKYGTSAWVNRLP